MKDLKKQWENVTTVSGSRIKSILEIGSHTLRSIQEFVKRVSEKEGVEDLTKRTSLYLYTCFNHLMDEKRNDFYYLKFIESLYNLYPQLLDKNKHLSSEAEKELLGLLERIALFHDLYSNKIVTAGQQSGKAKLIGAYLREMDLVTKEQLLDALDAQRAGQYPDNRIGDILTLRGIITRAQLDHAIELQMVDYYEKSNEEGSEG